MARFVSRLSAALLLLLLLAANAARQQPNLIWLLTDDMDAHGYQVMPHLREHFLAGGREFTNAFVASPKCCPSRTSALSGRFNHGMNGQQLGWCGNFAPAWENRTFFAGLQTAGYNTAMIGKFFNEEPSFCEANIHVPVGISTFFAMCKEVQYYNMSYNDNGVMTHTGDGPDDYLTAVLGNRSLAFLDAATANGTASPPFFLYLSVHAPHLPAVPAPWHANASVPTTAPRTPNWNTGQAGKHWQVAVNPAMDDYFISTSDAVYADRMRTLLAVDDAIAAIMELLTARGVLNDTFIVFSSDHGYHNGQYALWAEKSQAYDTDTRIPFLVRGPGIPPNSTSDALVAAIDVGATLLELAGAVAPGERTTDGRSFVSLLSGRDDDEVDEEDSADDGGEGNMPPVMGADERTPRAAWVRDRVLIEFPGYPTQWLGPCASAEKPPGVTCPRPAGVPLSLIDDPSNCYSALRIINATHNVLYAEYRPGGAAITPSSTNFTEAYDYSADPWALTNCALPGPAAWPAATLAQLSTELWAVANCQQATCP